MSTIDAALQAAGKAAVWAMMILTQNAQFEPLTAMICKNVECNGNEVTEEKASRWDFMTEKGTHIGLVASIQQPLGWELAANKRDMRHVTGGKAQLRPGSIIHQGALMEVQTVESAI